MREIRADARTISELLRGQKYSVDYYQREYKWEEKQVQELLEDLSIRFLEDYDANHPAEAVARYGRYFLGSVIISWKDSTKFIVDGQQRLTTLTLLLIYLRNVQKSSPDPVPIDDLIYSWKHGKRSFNLAVSEREPLLQKLFSGESYDDDHQSESVRNMQDRYVDIQAYFPQEIAGHALPLFIDWLIDNVHLVEITAYSDDDAYTIFETMNDRGLSLSPVDMLKGYLLANIADSHKRNLASDRWRDRTLALREHGKETEPEFFKAWLRSQYAMSVRDSSKNAVPRDFDRLGPEFHRWVKEHADAKHDDPLVLQSSDDFFRFIDRDFAFFSRIYERLIQASAQLIPGWEHIFYNAKQGFTLQYMVLMASLTPQDDDDAIKQKVRSVAMYLDILLVRRIWNYRRNTYSQMYRPMFQLAREIRGMDASTLGEHLFERFGREAELEESRLGINPWFGLNLQNRWPVHLVLARMTDFVEQGSARPSRYLELVNAVGDQRFEVEHIWANHLEYAADEYSDMATFQSDRNRIGGLLLLPKKFNTSYGGKPYIGKYLPYYSQNLLAASLQEAAYTNDPGFAQFRKATGLPFQPHPQFEKADLQLRRELYVQIAERIWDPALLLGQG